MSTEIIGGPSAPDLGLHRALRAPLCVALFALATAGCGGARVFHESTVPEGISDDAATCGTYTPMGDHVVARHGELAGIPYLEVVLGDVDPCSPLPLVVILHGLGDHPDVPQWPYRDLPVAVRMVLPHGPIAWGDGYAWSSVRVLDHEEDGLCATMSVQAERVASFVAAWAAMPRVRGDVILTGFSQGAILGLTVLMRHPEHLALVMPLAGWVPDSLRAQATPGSPPIRWIHGIDDERVPFAMALDAATDLRARGFDVEVVAYAGERHHMSHAMDERFHSWLVQALDNLLAGRPLAEGFVLVP